MDQELYCQFIMLSHLILKQTFETGYRYRYRDIDIPIPHPIEEEIEILRCQVT